MNKEKAMFGAGCFWGVEEVFRKIEGVVSTEVGYSGGDLDNPSYEDVCTDTTGHAEVILIDFDSDIVSYDTLVRLFFKMHDPTTLNRQGPDFGSQYRSAIFYYNDIQKETAQNIVTELTNEKKFDKPIVTIIEKANKFWRAEEYHQKYFVKKPGRCHIKFDFDRE